MSKWFQISIFLLVAMASIGLVSAGTQFNVPSCWILSSTGTPIDTNCDGTIDLSNNTLYLNGFSSAYFTPLALHIADNTSIYSTISTLNIKVNTINASLQSEITVRTNSDIALNDSILVTASGLSNETSARSSNDSSLQAQINNISGNSSSNLALILAVNSSLNTQISIESSDNSSLWSNKLNVSDQRYNDTSFIISNYYNVTYIDVLISNYYNKSEVDFLISNISSLTNYYTKTETNSYYNYSSTIQTVNTTLNDRIDLINASSIASSNYSQYTNISNAQSLNDSVAIASVNSSLNTLRNIDSADNSSLWLNKLNTSDQRYNNTLAITTVANNQAADNTSLQTQTTNLRTSNITTNGRIDSLNNTKLVDVTSANSYIGVSGTLNKSLAFSESTLNNTITKALATTYYNATSVLTLVGTPSGNIAGLQEYNGYSYNVTEDSSAIDIRVNFTNVTQNFNQLIIRYKTINGEVHTPNIYLWSYSDNAWEGYSILGSTDNSYIFNIVGVYDPSEHINNSLVQLRIFQNTSVPSKTDLWQFDWITLSRGVASQVGTETDPLSIHKTGDVTLTGNWDAGSFNITAEEFKGKLNASYIQNSYFATQTDNITLHNKINNVNTSTNIKSLGFNLTTELNTIYGIKTSSNEWTGYNKFNPTTNTSFYGLSLFYGTAYYLDQVVFSNSSVINVGMSGITLKNIANQTIGIWNDTNGKGHFWTDGTINSTGNIYEEGILLNTKYNNTAAITTVANNQAADNTSIRTITTTLTNNNITVQANIGTVNTTAVNALSLATTANNTATAKASPGTATCAAGTVAQNVTTTTTGTTSQCTALSTPLVTAGISGQSQIKNGTLLAASNAYYVSTLAELQAALNDTSNSYKYIYITTTISLSSNTLLELYGTNEVRGTLSLNSYQITTLRHGATGFASIYLYTPVFVTDDLTLTYTIGSYTRWAVSSYSSSYDGFPSDITFSLGTASTSYYESNVDEFPLTGATQISWELANLPAYATQTNLLTVNTTAINALPKAGGTMTGNITVGNNIGWYVNSTVYSVYNGTCWDTRNGGTHLYVCG